MKTMNHKNKIVGAFRGSERLTKKKRTVYYLENWTGEKCGHKIRRERLNCAIVLSVLESLWGAFASRAGETVVQFSSYLSQNALNIFLLIQLLYKNFQALFLQSHCFWNTGMLLCGQSLLLSFLLLVHNSWPWFPSCSRISGKNIKAVIPVLQCELFTTLSMYFVLYRN